MSKKIGYIYILSMVCGWILAGCSTTKNLPEGETLYVGIDKIDFGEAKKQKKKRKTDEKGVITSVAEAYKTVDAILTSKTALPGAVVELTDEQKDSIKAVEKAQKETYETVKSEVKAALSYPPNNSVLGSSSLRFPLPVGLWAYNAFVGKESRFSKWLFGRLAATPVYVTTVNPEVRAKVAQNTLRNYGFFRGTVDFEILPQKNPRKAKIRYDVSPRNLFMLDSVAYLKFAVGTDSLIRKTWNARLLRKGDPFSVINLDGERNRLYKLFRNEGFYFYQPEYITFRADTVARKGFVQLQVKPADDIPPFAQKKYRIGETRITIYNQDSFVLTDTIRRRDYTMMFADKKHKAPLKLGAIRRNLYYRKGYLYRQELMDFVQQRLSEMEVFSSVNMKYVPRDSMMTSDTLDVEIVGILDKPYDSEFTTQVTSKSNGQVGPGISFGMSKRNAFRGAEKLKLELHGSYEWQTNTSVVGNSSRINSYEYGTSLSLNYPRIIFPGAGRRMSRRALTGTVFTLDATWMNRANYFGMVSFSARVMYTYQGRATLKHEFVPFRLDYDELLSTTPTFDSIMNANKALYVSMRNQFIPSMRYTLTYSSPRRAHNPRSFIFEIKESGNLTSGIYAAFGQPFNQKDKKLFNVPFAQYVRLSAEFREEFKLTPRTSIATRAGVGAIFSYGNSLSAPYNDLFSVGGANSIRAFTARGVGPGSYTPQHGQYSYIDQMGDFKLELNAEYRFPIISSLYGAVFLDAGNVWLMDADPNRPGGTFDLSRLGKDLALGTGFGVRYDLDFLVLRFDIGVGIHAPYDTGKSGYYNMPKFKDSLGYHLAVGYPF